MERAALDSPLERFGIDDQAAIVSDGDPLYPYVTGLTVHFHFHRLGDDRLTTEAIGDAAAGQYIAARDLLRRRARLPSERLRTSLDACNRPRTFELRIVGGRP